MSSYARQIFDDPRRSAGRAVVALLALGLCARSAHAEEPRPHRSRVIALAAATAVFVASETFLKGSLVPNSCRWCAPNALDRAVRDGLLWTNTSRAKRMSDITGFVATPVMSLGLLAVAGLDEPQPGLHFINDALPVFEAFVYTQLVTNVVKYSVARERPEVHFAAPGRTPSTEDNLSFFSGHTSTAFSIAVAAGVVAHRRETPLEPIIWGTGLALATVTGYLRIAGDKHYFTDVLVGAAVGTAGGVLVPRLTGGLTSGHHDLRVMPAGPTGTGVTLVGVF